MTHAPTDTHEVMRTSGVSANQVGSRSLAPPRAAEPLPLGFLGLALASFAFATVQLDWIGTAQGSTVALCVLFFTVPVQLLASIAGFVRAELAPATGMGVLAGTWAAVSLVTIRCSRSGSRSHRPCV